ncbi:unnamed protein product [Macrosiphum euphorbiae]|uniref:Uncharacterized protein n=1 Tax=Macrosiphum euphorbiae TaxID=13131 RepID=A0AAV0X708_9HEMI|nr:unnamed protein product [Macrosiphum euphorbiae]
MAFQSRTQRMLSLAKSSKTIYPQQLISVSMVSHKFLTTGHTQMPVDSMHSRIEIQKQRALKSGPVYIPAHWVSIIKLAKKKWKTVYHNSNEYKRFLRPIYFM